VSTSPKRTSQDPEPAAAGGSPSRPRGRHRRLKIAAWIIIPLVVLALIVFVLPTYAARYIVRSQLDDMGITTEGIDTLRIDVWNREIWLGPVLFRGEQAPFGEVEEVGLKVGVLNLFHRQALIRTLVIKGVDIQVTREKDGNITINGVDLSRYSRPKEQQPPPKEEETRWGAGLDDFRFVNSRIFYTDRARGTVEVDIDNLELYEFRTWQPDHPGRFLLDARVNNMGFQAEGTARPFGETVHADIKMSANDVELDKVARYTGPLGFERRSGTLRAELASVVEAGKGTVDATVKGQVVESNVDANRPDQIAAKFDKAVLTLDNRYRLDGGTGTLTGPVHFAINNALFTIGGGSSLRLDAGTIDVPALKAEQAEALTQVGMQGSIKLSGIEAQTAGKSGSPSPSLQAAAIETGLKDVRVTMNDGTTKLAGGLDLAVSGLQASLPQAEAEARRIAAQRATLSLSDLDVTTGQGQTGVSASGTTEVEGLSAALPAAEGKPPIEGGIERVHLDLGKIDATLGGAEPRWSAALNAAISALNAAVGGGDLAKASISEISLTGARADQSLAIGADKLSLGATDVALTRKVLTAFSGGGQKSGEQAEGAGKEGGGAKPNVRLGAFTLTSPAKIAFTDTSVSPEVQMQADVKTLQVQRLDMADPSQRTDLRLAAVVNEFTDIDASGWVAPFGGEPDFSLLAQINKLELPPLSPYAAQAVGMNIDSGRLNLKADASADGGKLDGTILVDLRNLAFGALSKEDAERLSARIGVPIETVVGLLQDSQGKIDLRIPISGNLASPDFDITDAIGQAVTGAVTAAVTAPFKLLFEPVGALASAVGGGGVSFKPIAFAPGAATLGPEAQVFVDNLAKMLKERPKLSLHVCGKSTPADLQALRARGELPQPQPPAQPTAQRQPAPPPVDDQARSALTRLAEERTRVVRQQLVEKRRIGANQVAECRAAFEPQGKQGPRVDISF
jgi:hypothetical protein